MMEKHHEHTCKIVILIQHLACQAHQFLLTVGPSLPPMYTSPPSAVGHGPAVVSPDSETSLLSEDEISGRVHERAKALGRACSGRGKNISLAKTFDQIYPNDLLTSPISVTPNQGPKTQNGGVLCTGFLSHYLRAELRKTKCSLLWSLVWRRD